MAKCKVSFLNRSTISINALKFGAFSLSLKALKPFIKLSLVSLYNTSLSPYPKTKRLKDLSNSKRLHGAMKVYVEKVTALVQRATKVKVGQIYKAYKSVDDDATKPDTDPKDHANNLKMPENVMTLNDSYASLKQQLQERKAMAFPKLNHS